MKIRRLSNNLVSANDSLESISLSPKMQLIFGPIDADTTNVRDSIRWLFFGENASGVSSKFLSTDIEFEFPAGPAVVSRTKESLRDFDPEMRREFDRTLLEIDGFTYESFFDVNFGEGSIGGYELCQLLRKRFSVPFGDHSVGESELYDEERIQTLRQELSGVDFQVHDLSNERNKIRREIELLEQQNVQPREFLISQKQSLENRIEGLRDKLEKLRVRAFDVEKEIDQLTAARFPAAAIEPIAVQKNNSTTALDIEALDQQINRWKTVQTDINSRITDLKGNLSSTRIDEFDGAFDEIRALLRCSEGKISELDSSVDATNTQRNEFQSLQAVNHQICDALSEIQTQWRQRLVSNELRDLHRCTDELNGYLQRLNEKRLQSTNQNGIRSPKGGSSQMSARFCECTSHGVGFLPDNSKLIEQLNSQLDELLDEIENTQRLLNSALSEYHSINEKADHELLAKLAKLKLLLEAKNDEIKRLHVEKQQLEKALGYELAKPRQRVSRCLQFASNYVSELTNGKISRLYLSDEGSDVVLVDENRQLIHYNSANLTTRNKVRIAISLAACSLLAENGYLMPLVLEDAFVGFDETDVDLATRLFQRFTKTTSQIVLLTNNRFIRDYFAMREIPCLDLPDKYSGDAIPTRPRDNDALPNTRYSVSSKMEDVNRSLDFAAMDQNGTELVWQEDVTGKIRVTGELHHHAIQNELDSSHLDTDHYSAGIVGLNRNSSQNHSGRTYEPLSGSRSSESNRSAFESKREDVEHDRNMEYRGRTVSIASETDFDSRSDRAGSRIEADRERRNSRTSSSDRSSSSRSGTNRSSSNWTNSNRSDSSRSDRSRTGRSRRSNENRSNENRSRERRSGESRSGRVYDAISSNRKERSTIESSERVSQREVTKTTRFYLALSDNVEAAPTIGPKTAEHLEKIGIVTVSELVETDPGWIANELSNKRIKEADVEQWQYQAMLICQVPNLRGHDVQVLVACGIREAEQLASMDPDTLFGIVGPYSKTKEGQKWLRGAKVPDLAEVKDWINWAQEMRPLDQAA